MAGQSIFSKLLLYPVSRVYGAVMYVRNRLFDWGVLSQQEFDIPVIVVGNISAGGTGKTPLVEYIVEHLSTDYNVGVLSRGYKRRTKGFVMAHAKSKPVDIGDEPFQIYAKFGRQIPVAVCEDRVKGIKQMREQCPDVNLVVLDDAYQHRHVKPTVSIVVTEYSRPIFSDKLLPYGRLREPMSALQRADMVMVSKCPDEVKPAEVMIFKENLSLLHYQKTYFSHLVYEHLQPVFPKVAPAVGPSLSMLSDRDMVLSVAGIGNPKPFVRYIKSFNARVWVNVFPDHHDFDEQDMQLLVKRYRALTGINNFIVTTEKDAVRMANSGIYPDELKAVTYFLPVSVEVLNNEAENFLGNIRKLIKNHKFIPKR